MLFSHGFFDSGGLGWGGGGAGCVALMAAAPLYAEAVTPPIIGASHGLADEDRRFIGNGESEPAV